MPRPCIVCSRSDRQSIEELIAAGASDYAVARQFGIERRSVCRHRAQHIDRPMRDRLAIIAKDTAARRERQELAAAAASDTPSTQALVEATLGLRRQVEKLSAIEGRLERMATVAEGTGSSAGVAQLAAQQFRGIETGARLVGLGGFAPQRLPDQAAYRPQFSVSIIFPNARREEQFTLTGDSGDNGAVSPAAADRGEVVARSDTVRLPKIVAVAADDEAARETERDEGYESHRYPSDTDEPDERDDR